MDNDLSNLLTMQLFLAYALACKKLAKACGETPAEIEKKLQAEAQMLLEDNKVSPADLEAIMRSVIPE